jgi:hypothetical protein
VQKKEGECRYVQQYCAVIGERQKGENAFSAAVALVQVTSVLVAAVLLFDRRLNSSSALPTHPPASLHLRQLRAVYLFLFILALLVLSFLPEVAICAV